VAESVANVEVTAESIAIVGGLLSL
jgi:hypothetical protein